VGKERGRVSPSVFGGVRREWMEVVAWGGALLCQSEELRTPLAEMPGPKKRGKRE